MLTGGRHQGQVRRGQAEEPRRRTGRCRQGHGRRRHRGAHALPVVRTARTTTTISHARSLPHRTLTRTQPPSPHPHTHAASLSAPSYARSLPLRTLTVSLAARPHRPLCRLLCWPLSARCHRYTHEAFLEARSFVGPNVKLPCEADRTHVNPRTQQASQHHPTESAPPTEPSCPAPLPRMPSCCCVRCSYCRIFPSEGFSPLPRTPVLLRSF